MVLGLFDFPLNFIFYFLATCKTWDIIVIFSLVKEKLGCGFLASSLFVWSCNCFCIFILVSYHFHPFGIHFFLALIIDVFPNLIMSKF